MDHLFVVPVYPGCPGKEAIKRVCVCVYYHIPVYIKDD